MQLQHKYAITKQNFSEFKPKKFPKWVNIYVEQTSHASRLMFPFWNHNFSRKHTALTSIINIMEMIGCRLKAASINPISEKCLWSNKDSCWNLNCKEMLWKPLVVTSSIQMLTKIFAKNSWQMKVENENQNLYLFVPSIHMSNCKQAYS